MKREDAVEAAKYGIGLYEEGGAWYEAFTNDGKKFDYMSEEEEGLALRDSTSYAAVLSDYIEYGALEMIFPDAREPILLEGRSQPFI